ncbi:MAG: hypothetical protein RIR06_1056 [Bacteroidota bacterium]
MNRAEHLINPHLPVLSSSDSAPAVLHLMDEWRVTELALVQDGMFLGLISESSFLDLELFEGEIGTQAIEIKDVRVLPQAHVLDVLKNASANQTSVVPVVLENGMYVGSIPVENLIQRLSHLLGAATDGGIIVLQLGERDQSIQQVARIVEENGAKILSLSVAPTADNLVEMHVKVNVQDLNPILQSLARFGYVVSDQFQKDEFNHELKDRYDELMRYLNI